MNIHKKTIHNKKLKTIEWILAILLIISVGISLISKMQFFNDHTQEIILTHFLFAFIGLAILHYIFMALSKRIPGVHDCGIEHQFETLTDSLPQFIYRLNTKLQIVSANEAYCKSYNLEKKDIIGKTSMDLFPKDMAEKFMASDRKVIQTGEKLENIERNINEKGDENWVRVVKVPIKNSKGKITGMTGIYWDITESRNAQIALKKSEEHLRDLFKAMKDVVLVLDEKGKYLEIAPTSPDLLYKPATELLGKTLHETFDKDIADIFLTKVQESLSKSKELKFEYPLFIDKEELWFEGRISPKTENSVLFIAHDISDRKQTEAALKKSEQLKTALINYSPIGISVRNKNGTLLLANQAWRNLWDITQKGIKQDTILRENFAFDERDDYLKEHHENIKKIYEFGGEYFIPEVKPHKSNSKKAEWISQLFYAIPNSKGDIDEVVILTEDISVRKRAEKALLQSQKRYQDLYDNAPDMYFSVSKDGITKSVNQFGADSLGYKIEELVGHSVWQIVHKDDLAFVQKQIGDILDKKREPGELDFRKVCKDGTVLYVHERLQLVETSEGTEIRIICRDVTSRRKAEEEKLALERQVQHAQKLESLGVLAGGIAHDFNNLLTAILGNADLALLNLSPLSPAKKNIDYIISATHNASELAKQMLAYSGKGHFIVENIQLSEIILEMSHLLDVAISKNVVIKEEFADNVPPIEADATQIRQIIMNLITNASEAIGKKSGIISIRTGVMHCNTAYFRDLNIGDNLVDGTYSYFEVSDTGSGMEEEAKQKIFDPFFSTKFTGRGLGMAAVLGIVRGHKGSIKVYSEVGKGTTIKVLFPASEKSLDTTKLTEIKEQIAIGEFSGTILLVDDEESVRVVASNMLKAIGFNVLTATDGLDALSVFKNNPDIKLIILDYMMPHMDGEQAYREIRQLNKEVPIVMSSGYNEQNITQRFTGKGLAGFIQKPYQLAKLMTVLLIALKE